MARKELNIFGTSFLDLLSGALAAVIILFVIVPKMSADQQEALEEMERLNVQVEELSDLMERVQNSVPQELYDEIQQQIEALQNTAEALRNEVESLQQRVAALEAENRETNRRNQTLEAEARELQERIQELERQLAQSADNENANGISDGRVFGMNAQLGVVCQWPERNPDVDLYVKNRATGEICYYGKKETSFGSLKEDVQSRSDADDDRYELFYQSRLKPGTYEIYVQIYSGQDSWNGHAAHVEGYVVLFPGKRNQKKINYSNIVIRNKGVNVRIGTLTVTQNDITLR